MGLFGNLTDDGLEQKEDRVGGGSYSRETDAYELEIKVAYAGKTTAGAQFIAMTFHDDGGKEYRETFYITGKNGLNYYMAKDKDGKETGKKRALAGFDHINDICLVTTDKPLSAQETEEKTVKVYDPDAKQELPKSVQVLVDLLGKKVYLAIYKRLENKNQKDSNGNYVAIADTRDTNTTEKVFHYPTKMTVKEATDGAEAPTLFDSWVEAHKGKVMDRRTIKDGEAGQTGRPGRSAGAPPTSGGSSGGERKSLFGK
jgi:hypothetical protein